MRNLRYLFCFTLGFNVLITCSQTISEQVEIYLDSSRTALRNDRADQAIEYLIKAEALSETIEDIDFDILHSLHYDYREAFNAIGQNKIAESHQRRVLNQIKQETKKDENDWLKMYYLNIGQMAGIFLSNQQYDSAHRYLSEGLEIANKYENYRYIAGAYNNLGILYLRNQQYDSAILSFSQALNHLELNGLRDSLFELSINDNIADWLIVNDSLSKAQELLEYNFEVAKEKSKNYQVIFFRGFELLDLYLLLQKNNLALDIISQLDSIVNLGEDKWLYENKLLLIEAKMQLVENKGQSNLLMTLLKEHDSLRTEQHHFNQNYYNKVNTAISRYINRSIENELARTKEKVLAEKKDSRNRIILFSTLLLIAISLAMLLNINYRRKLKIKSTEKLLAESELKLKEIQNAKLNSELDYKNKDFSQLLMQTTLEGNWSHNIIRRLNVIKKEKNNIELLESLIIELKQKSNFYDKLKIEQKGMLAANAAFYDRLSKQFPQLTKSEKETCGLMRMNIQTNEVAMVRNIDPSSVRKLRQRIKKKLGLSVDEDLYEYIKNI